MSLGQTEHVLKFLLCWERSLDYFIRLHFSSPGSESERLSNGLSWAEPNDTLGWVSRSAASRALCQSLREHILCGALGTGQAQTSWDMGQCAKGGQNLSFSRENTELVQWPFRDSSDAQISHGFPPKTCCSVLFWGCSHHGVRKGKLFSESGGSQKCPGQTEDGGNMRAHEIFSEAWHLEKDNFAHWR